MEEIMSYTAASSYVDIDSTTSATSNGFIVNSVTGGLSYISSNGITIDNPYASSSTKTFAIRKRKKKKIKGDKTGAQDKSNRIGAGPVVIFRFLKKKFSMFEAEKLYKRYEQIATVLENIHPCQIALTEEIEKKALKVMREATMASCGFNKFIEGDFLNKYIDLCKNKVIKISRIKNYVRFIPKKVRDKMEKAERKALFDGYVVVHTDPNDTSVMKTVEEKKDPILFGVISESDRFYFIADWKDELCDLTLEKIVDKLGLDDTDYKMDNDFGKTFSD